MRGEASVVVVVVLLLIIPLPLSLAAPSPVVLIPGNAASVLEIKFDHKEHVPHFWCSKSTHGKWQRLWIPNPIELLPKEIDCWTDNMMRHYNATHVFNTPGVEIRPKKETLIRNTYKALLDSLKETTTVKLLTYDFRVAPNLDLMEEIKTTVETLYKSHQSQKVTLISHSMGALYVHYFLTQIVDSHWKDQYLQAWIPMAPAYGGVIYGLKQVVSGDHVHIPWLTNQELVQEQRSCEGSLWLMPRHEIYGDQILVQTPARNYTAHNYSALARAAGFKTFDHQWTFVKDLTEFEKDNDTATSSGQHSHQQLLLKDPRIPVYPMYGTNVTTVAYFQYDDSLANEPKVVNTRLGDSVVNKESLEAGNHWAEANKPLIVAGITHIGILSEATAIARVNELVSGKHDEREAEGSILSDH